jgi:hypothetical protein
MASTVSIRPVALVTVDVSLDNKKATAVSRRTTLGCFLVQHPTVDVVPRDIDGTGRPYESGGSAWYDAMAYSTARRELTGK